MTKKVDQMANSFFEMAQILEFPFSCMFEDMIRGSLLIMVLISFLRLWLLLSDPTFTILF